MLKKKTFTIFMLVSCFLVTGGLFSSNLHAERITFVPSLDLEYQHDSNYFKSENDEKSVDTFIVRPGISLGYITAKSSFSFDYSFDVNEYSGEKNIDDYDYTGHLAKLMGKSQVTDRLSLGIDNAYIKTRDPASADLFSNEVARDKYSMNRFTPSVFYKFGEKFGLGAKFTNLITDYSEGVGEDSDENRGTFTLNYNLNRSVELSLDYQVWTRDYDANSSDYTSNQVMANVKKMYRNFSIMAGAGYHTRDFDEPGIDTLNSPAWTIGMNGRTGASDNAAPKSWLNVSLGQNYNDSGSGDEYYQATKFNLTAGHTFLKRIDVILKGLYQNSDYEVGSREDDKWSLACRANYRINDTFSFALEPGYETRDSNESGRDYDNSYILFNAKVQYDFAGRM
ncbi:MAG: outer membrane beta-barrel protein [Desulfobacterium sp.]